MAVPQRGALRRVAMVAACGLIGACTGCGSGSGGQTTGATASAPALSSPAGTSPAGTPPASAGSPLPYGDPTFVYQMATCEASGKGTDYQVGPGAGQLASLDAVPWERLKAGDTVRIFWQSQPYKGKFLLTANGTADAPVRVCGVKGAGGERPVIDGSGATTRRGLVYGGASAAPIHEARGIVMIKNTDEFTHYPTYIQIDGLSLKGVHPDYRFTDSNGTSSQYMEFGGCIWVERGHNITIADNEISDCTHAIFSRSFDYGDFAVTNNLRIAGNTMTASGVSGSDKVHTTYIQSRNVIYEFNRYGPMRSGAEGNSLKDRSIGPVIRYNRIEDGARAMDLVEAEDWTSVAKADPAYRSTFVYGNQIIKDGDKGSTIHYGGDHAGSEADYRKGTLYFFNNTVRLTGNGYGVLFQLSTTEERAEVWNNVFLFDATIPFASMRAGQDNAPGYTAGGIVNLGRNWINSRWADSDPDHPIPGQLLGASNMITGTTAPVDPITMVPLAASAVIDAAASGPAAAAAYPVRYQIDIPGARVVSRTVIGASGDLGAVEAN